MNARTHRLLTSSISAGLAAIGVANPPARADCPKEPTYELRVQPTHDLTLSVALGDLDGDGDIDMVASGSTSDGILVYLNSGDATFTSGVGYEPSSRASVALGDVDGDGDLDIVSSAGGVTVLLNHADGTFEPAVTYPGGGGGTIALADLDGDGDLDAAAADFGGAVFVSFNAGDGTFSAPTGYAMAGITRSLAVGDLDGDADVDIVAAVEFSSASVLYNNGDGTFATQVDFPSGGLAYGVTLGDLDGNGRLDIALAIANTGSVSVLYNLGGHSFTAPVAYPVAGITLSVDIADLDADGDADMVATFLDPAGGPGAGVLFNNGADFDPPVIYMAGLVPWDVKIGDLDGHGSPDFVMGDQNGSGLFIFLDADALAVQIGGQPQGVMACEGQPVEFSVKASGSEPITYQWRKDGVEIKGAVDASYSIASLSTKDTGVYDVVVTNPCGSVTSDGATLTVLTGSPCCVSDWNHNGVVESADVSDFINDWFIDQLKESLITDWDGNGVANSTDVSQFINSWFEDLAAGCG